MSFQFQSLHDFLWMEGHGPYVWAAYAITFLGLIALALKPVVERKNFYKRQAPLARRRAQEP